MKKKLLITALVLTGAYSGLYPMELAGPSNQLEWKHVNNINLDTSHAKKFGMGAFLATGAVGAAATWGASKYISPENTAFGYGMVGGLSLAAGYFAYKNSLNYINTAQTGTNSQINVCHNLWVNIINQPFSQLNQSVGMHRTSDLSVLPPFMDNFVDRTPGKEIHVDIGSDELAAITNVYNYEHLATLRRNRINSSWLLGSKNIQILKEVDNTLNVVIKATADLPDEKEENLLEKGEYKQNYKIYLDPNTKKFTAYDPGADNAGRLTKGAKR